MTTQSKGHWIYKMAEKWNIDLAFDKVEVIAQVQELLDNEKYKDSWPEIENMKAYLNKRYFNVVTRQNAASGQHFEHMTKTNKDGTALRARRSGATKTWKTRPNEFKIPVKYGLYESFYIDHNNCDEWIISS